jgi:hypothetical protein
MPLNSGISLANLLGLAAPAGHIWVVDGGQGFTTGATTTILTRIDGSNPAAPTVTAQVDLSAYGGASRVVKVHRNNVFVGLFPLGATNGNRPDGRVATPFVIVDKNTGAVVGLGSVGVNGDLMRPRDFAFDGAGNVFVDATDTQTGIMKIYKYSIASIIAAFPSVYSTPLAVFPASAVTSIASGSNGQSLPQGTVFVASTTGFPASGNILVVTNFGPQLVKYTGTSGGSFTGCTGGSGTMTTGGQVSSTGVEHYENITYGAGFLWATTGLYNTFGSPSLVKGRVIRIDPVTGATNVYTGGVAAFGGTGIGYFWGCLFAFGSLWVTGANQVNSRNKIFRFDPANFPADPTVIVVDPGNTMSNTAELVADNTTIWVTNGSSFVQNEASVWRISTGVGTEAVIAHVSATGLPGTPGNTQCAAWDGTTIWTVLRSAPNPGGVGVLSFTTGLGTESYIQRFNPSGLFHDPVSIAADNTPASMFVPTYFKQPISLTFDGSHLWVADMSTSLVQKVDPAGPGVTLAVNLASLGVTVVRKVKYNNGIVYCCCHDSGVVALIDTTTNTVVGKCNLIAGDRARSVTFDGAGNFWISSILTTTSTLTYARLYKFSIASTLAAFPSAGTSLQTTIYSHHIEEIDFANGHIWASNGGARNIEFGDEYGGGSTASITASGANATVTGLTGMTAQMVGSFLLFSNTTSPQNSVAFKITAFNSATSVNITAFDVNPATDPNNGNIVWKFIRGSSGSEALMRIDPNETRGGGTASITVAGTWPNITVTISGLSGITNADIGKCINISNATGSCSGGFNNNTFFTIKSVTNSSTVITDIGSYNKGRYAPGFSNCKGVPVTDANNGSLVWSLLNSHVTVDLDNGYVWGVNAFFGSLWSGNGNRGLTRWDPTNYDPIPPIFPFPTNPIFIQSPTNKVFFQGQFASDGTYVWTTATYGAGGAHAAIRINPSNNTIIAEIPTDQAGYADDIAFDGTNIWVTQRNNTNPGLVRFSTGVGTEAQTFRLV